MGKMLVLEDLKDMSRADLLTHISKSYEVDLSVLKGCGFVIAYESVGNWGCDSSSFFLFRKDGKLYEVNGSHCSCHGFEDQWTPDETSVVALKSRIKSGHLFYGGGYDDDEAANRESAEQRVLRMRDT